jgi:phage terminase large subunit GpA-like protein
LVKGASSKDAPRVVESYPDTSGRKDRGASAGDVPVLMLNTNILKDAVAADLERFADGQGVAHLPTWLSAEVFAEFTAEVRTAAGWVNPSSARNEAFDLAVYPRALCIQLELDRPGWWDSPPVWALPWDRNPTLISGLPVAPPAQRSFADIARILNG